MESRKIYDSDVVTIPLLRSIAEQYSREYIGNFDMMIAAKQEVLSQGRLLSDGTIRAVLNTLRTDPLRRDLQAAVSSILRHPSLPQPEDMAQVIDFDQTKRRRDWEAKADRNERKRAMQREVYLRYRLDQFQVHARFATTRLRANQPVLHWLQPDGHKLDWRLKWDRNYEEECAKGNGVQREFHLTLQAFCRPLFGGTYRMWTQRPDQATAWPTKDFSGPLTDCKSCLRHIGLAHMDCYPPDRNFLTGEYPT